MGRTLRKIHYWLTAFTLLTLIVIATTGVLLTLKKEFAALQPPTASALSPGLPKIPLDQLIGAVASEPNRSALSWHDVDRIDVRPSDGLAKVILNDRTEYQVDLHTVRVLQTGYRTSDLLESIHDFSFLGGTWSKYLISLPSGIALIVLWATGGYMFIQPMLARRRKRRGKTLARKP